MGSSDINTDPLLEISDCVSDSKKCSDALKTARHAPHRTSPLGEFSADLFKLKLDRHSGQIVI